MKKVETEGTKQFNFRLSTQLMREAQEKANKEGFDGNRTKFVDFVLRQYITQNDKLGFIRQELKLIKQKLDSICENKAK